MRMFRCDDGWIQGHSKNDRIKNEFTQVKVRQPDGRLNERACLRCAEHMKRRPLGVPVMGTYDYGMESWVKRHG